MAEKPARKIPERRCTGCGGHFPKNTLVRIVRSPDGNIALDPTGRAAGRSVQVIAQRREIIVQSLSQTFILGHDEYAKSFS